MVNDRIKLIINQNYIFESNFNSNIDIRNYLNQNLIQIVSIVFKSKNFHFHSNTMRDFNGRRNTWADCIFLKLGNVSSRADYVKESEKNGDCLFICPKGKLLHCHKRKDSQSVSTFCRRSRLVACITCLDGSKIQDNI